MFQVYLSCVLSKFCFVFLFLKYSNSHFNILSQYFSVFSCISVSAPPSWNSWRPTRPIWITSWCSVCWLKRPLGHLHGGRRRACQACPELRKSKLYTDLALTETLIYIDGWNLISHVVAGINPLPWWTTTSIAHWSASAAPLVPPIRRLPLQVSSPLFTWPLRLTMITPNAKRSGGSSGSSSSRRNSRLMVHSQS